MYYVMITIEAKTLSNTSECLCNPNERPYTNFLTENNITFDKDYTYYKETIKWDFESIKDINLVSIDEKVREYIESILYTHNWSNVSYSIGNIVYERD